MANPAHTHTIDGHPVATWIEPIVAFARRHGWQGVVNSGYRSTKLQAELYERYRASGFNPRFMAAKPGTSNHESAEYPRGAIDVSDPEEFWNIVRHWQGEHHLVWAISIGIQDRVHFSATGR